MKNKNLDNWLKEIMKLDLAERTAILKVVEKIIKEERHKLLAQLQTDSCDKALVIIEDREDGGHTQRPAQDEIKKFIEERIMEIEKIHQKEVISLLDDMNKQAERASDHYASCLADIKEKCIPKKSISAWPTELEEGFDNCIDEVTKNINKIL